MIKTKMVGSVFTSLVLASLFGCGQQGVHLSGKVTFKGVPLPAGKIYFMADGAKGNKGAAGYADVSNGHYSTSATGGKITPGGALRVAIEGWDPEKSGKGKKGDTSGEQTFQALFPQYVTNVDVGTSASTKDFDVPASAATRKDQPDTPLINP